MLFKHFLLCIAFCFMVSSLQAIDIYVSTKGNDYNAGTKSSPFATLTAARNKIRKMTIAERNADTINIFIEEGRYFLKEPLLLSPEDAGSKAAPIIFKGIGKTLPELIGAKQLPPFERVSENLWKVKIPNLENKRWYFEQLFVNGRRATRARYLDGGDFSRVRRAYEKIITPDPNGSYPKESIQTILINSAETNMIKQISENERRDLVFTFYHAWDITRNYITGVTDSSITMRGIGWMPWNPIDHKSTFQIENAKAFLNEAGEWFLDRENILYYIPRPGETPESTIAFVPVHEELMILAGNPKHKVSNIQFQNLSFKYTAFTLPVGGTEPDQASASATAAINLIHANNVSIVNCEITHTSNYGIWIWNGCNNNIIRKCVLTDLGAGGIKIGEKILPSNETEVTRNTIVDNSIITSGGHILPPGAGILILHSAGNSITHNEISDFRYTGISVGWVWGYEPSYAKENIVKYNHIHHLGWGELSDMGGIYLLGPAKGTVVSNNVIHDIYSYDYGGWGLYTDEGSSDVIIERNLVYRCKHSAYHQHYGKDNVLRNNIFASQLTTQIEATRIEEHTSYTFKNNIVYFDYGSLLGNKADRVRIYSDSNCFWDTRTTDIKFGTKTFTEWKNSGKDVHSIIADPRFKNVLLHNYEPTNKAVLKKINFIPLEISRAGVYGLGKWRKRAVPDKNLDLIFQNRSRRNEFISK